MKNIICFLLIIFSVFVADAQIKNTDSLKLLLRTERTDTGKVLILIYLGDTYWLKRNDSALLYFTDALHLSEKIGFTSGEIRSRSSLAEFLTDMKSDYATALELSLANLKLEEETGDTTHIFTDTRIVSFIYADIGDYEKELEYIKKLRNLTNSGLFKDSATLSRYRVGVNNRLGAVYEKLNILDSAKYYKLKVVQYGVAQKDRFRIAGGSFGLATIYRKLKNYDSAFYYCRISLPEALKRPEMYWSALLEMSNLHWETNQTDSAFYYSEKAFKLSQQPGGQLSMISAAELLAKIYYSKKLPDSAYKYLSLATSLKDSIFTSEKLVKVQNLSLQQSLQKLQQEQTKKEAVQEYKSSIKIYSLVAGLAGLLIFIFILYRNNRQRLIANKKIEKAYTDLKATQAQLVQKEKMASLGELTAGIAHEIQNPLNFVNNFSDVNAELMEDLQQELNNGNIREAKTIAGEVISNQHKVAHHGRRADGIVKSMLEHSRTAKGEKQLTEINALVEEHLRLAYHGFRAKEKEFSVDFLTTYDPAIGKLNVVPQDIGRVLMNLFSNAFYAVQEKKKLLNGTYEPEVSVSTMKVNGKVEICIKDNGSGIPQKVIDKIFQPFFTTKPTGEGTGLGLSLSYDIVTKGHGGELHVKTEEGQYTEFIIKLPGT